jgi:hypothetical protein
MTDRLIPDEGEIHRLMRRYSYNPTPSCEVCGHPLWAPKSIERAHCEACHIAITGRPTAYIWIKETSTLGPQ